MGIVLYFYIKSGHVLLRENEEHDRFKYFYFVL